MGIINESKNVSSLEESAEVEVVKTVETPEQEVEEVVEATEEEVVEETAEPIEEVEEEEDTTERTSDDIASELDSQIENLTSEESTDPLGSYLGDNWDIAKIVKLDNTLRIVKMFDLKIANAEKERAIAGYDKDKDAWKLADQKVSKLLQQRRSVIDNFEF